MKTFSDIFCSILFLVSYILVITFYFPFIFYYFQQVLFTLRVSSLLSPLNDASGDIIDDEGSFQFSAETEFTSPL